MTRAHATDNGSPGRREAYGFALNDGRGEARIGGDRCFIIAEAGVNHNGSPALAHRLIDIAANARADAVKFQTFDPALVATRAAARAPYQARGDTAGPQLEMLESLALPASAYGELQEHARASGLLFLSTPFDAPSADLLDELGVAAFKVASGELTNHPFLEYLAGKGRPLLVSTGMATLHEVEQAVEVLLAAGARHLALLHCVSSYPAAPGTCNLRAMATLRDRFGVPTGWSDHTLGTAVTVAAVALGAELVEKHFTVDRTLPGPDHAASLEPAELAALVQAVRQVESALGDGVKRPVPDELPVAQVARRALHASRDLPAGHCLTRDDLVALRPAAGLSPARLGDVVGRRLRTAVPCGSPLLEEHVGG
ncbi:MAG: N-acetylneuraminate synthase family protein [Gemmatimonadaceae bacterium]